MLLKIKVLRDIKNFLCNFINEKDPKNIKSRLRKRIADKDSLSLIEFYTDLSPYKKEEKEKEDKMYFILILYL
jgi:hypothetical protein